MKAVFVMKTRQSHEFVKGKKMKTHMYYYENGKDLHRFDLKKEGNNTICSSRHADKNVEFAFLLTIVLVTERVLKTFILTFGPHSVSVFGRKHVFELSPPAIRLMFL